MVEIKSWMDGFLQALDQTFAGRVWFVGLQGSYARGEATEQSDIDVVVIFDTFSAADARAYRAMLDRLPHRAQICGFCAGKAELLAWEASDLFQFYNDTLPVRGTLDALLPLLDSAAVDRSIRIGACNIYHGCVHNLLHGQSTECLKDLYKAATFVLQAICFRKTGRYVRHQSELLELLAPEDRVILEGAMALRRGARIAFDHSAELLFEWVKRLIQGEAQYGI